MDDAERGHGRELGPVAGAAEPVEVLAQEDVDGGAGVHDGVGKHHGRVQRRHLALRGGLGGAEDGQVGFVVAEEELEVQARSHLAREDAVDARRLGQHLRRRQQRRRRAVRGGGGCRRTAVHGHGFVARGRRRGSGRRSRRGRARQRLPHLAEELLRGVLVEVKADLVEQQQLCLPRVQSRAMVA